MQKGAGSLDEQPAPILVHTISLTDGGGPEV